MKGEPPDQSMYISGDQRVPSRSKAISFGPVFESGRRGIEEGKESERVNITDVRRGMRSRVRGLMMTFRL